MTTPEMPAADAAPRAQDALEKYGKGQDTGQPAGTEDGQQDRAPRGVPLLGSHPFQPRQRTISGVPVYRVPDLPAGTMYALAAARIRTVIRADARVEFSSHFQVRPGRGQGHPAGHRGVRAPAGDCAGPPGSELIDHLAHGISNDGTRHSSSTMAGSVTAWLEPQP